jgi:hypothetical protein
LAVQFGSVNHGLKPDWELALSKILDASKYIFNKNKGLFGKKKQTILILLKVSIEESYDTTI